MRYAVLSDIHGNLEALSAVLDALAKKRIDRTLCLGDTVGYGANPIECLSRLEDCGALMVAGNHEAACVGRLELEWFNDATKTSLVWTRDRLGFPELDRLRRLRLVETTGPLTLVHASLTHPERFDYLVDAGRMIGTLRRCETPICLTGHTHVPCVAAYDLEARRLLDVRLGAEAMAGVTPPPLCGPSGQESATGGQRGGGVTLDGDPVTRRYLINPGSVGQPRDGDPRAGAAVVDTEAKAVSFLRVAYDVAAAQRKITEAGLPAFFAERLAMGR